MINKPRTFSHENVKKLLAKTDFILCTENFFFVMRYLLGLSMNFSLSVVSRLSMFDLVKVAALVYEI